MIHQNRHGKINVKLVILLIVVTAGLGMSMVMARQIHRSVRSEKLLAAGEAAFGDNDWLAASRNFRSYLARNPDDLEVTRKYAEACLAVRPLDAQAVSGAIAAYRRIIQSDPQDDVAYGKLALLFNIVGSYDELSALAQTRLERNPNDPLAPLWLADALIRLNRSPRAEEVLTKFIDRIEALPDRHVEYVQACTKMSAIALAKTVGTAAAQLDPRTLADTKAKALEWLQRAVTHAPESVDALLSRARFYRVISEIPGIQEKDRPGLARQDLQEVDRRGPPTAQGYLFLAAEWLEHGEYGRTLAALQAGDKLPPQALQEQFFDVNDWVASQFLLKAEVAARTGTAAGAVAVTDQALASLTEKRHRFTVLPSAVLVYVTAGKVPEARRCCDEYQELVRTHEGSGLPPAESARRLARVQALVAGAENRPYAVIETLANVVGNDASNTELWRMLAEAYRRTDQTGRAIQALNQYCRLNPQDPRALLELAQQYSLAGNWSSAIEAVGKAQSQGASGPGLQVLRIGAALNLAVNRRGGVDTAELKKLSAELEELRQALPGEVDIRLLQAIIAGHLGRPEEVEQQLKLAGAECTDPLKAQLQLAAHYLQTKRGKEAVAICETACQAHPDAVEPWIALADAQVADKNDDGARRCLQQGLSSVSGPRQKRDLSLKLALFELTHGQPADGTRLLQDMAAQDPQDTQARILLLGLRSVLEDQATAQRLVTELKQAEGEAGLRWRFYQASLWLAAQDWPKRQKEIQDLLQFCLRADPTWSAPVLLASQVYERLGDAKRLEETCRQALAANPAATAIADRLLILLQKQGRFADAEKVLAQAQISPKWVSAWQIRIALGTKDYSRAMDELKLRAANDARDPNSRIELARLTYQQTKDANEALRYLKEAETLDADNWATLWAKASILRQEGLTADAQQALDEYVARHHDFTAYWMRAAYLAEAGDPFMAEKDFRKLPTFAQNGAAGYELLGRFYVATARLDQGVGTLEEGLRAYPENLVLKRNLMRLLLMRAQDQDRTRATEILGELERQLPADAELLRLRAARMLEQNTPESLAGARAKLESAVQVDPNVSTYSALIGIAMRQEQYQAACDYAIRALESNAGHPGLLLARARAELALGYTPMAARLAREVLQRDPNNPEALGLLTDSALTGGDRTLLQEVRTLTEARLARNPKNEALLISRARLLGALGLPQDAIPALEAYCRTEEGRRPAALVTLADLYRLTGAVDKAGQQIEQAERVDPNNQTVIYARHLWLASQNRWDQLRGISAAYLRAKEQNVAILLRAASLLAASNLMDLKQEGLKLFERAAVLSPTSVEVRLGLASASYQTGDVERAEKIYRDVLAQQPDNVRALNDLAWSLKERDRRSALELANRAMRLARDNPNLLDTRGTILMNMPGRLADAKRDFEEVVRLSPKDERRQAQALLQLGRIGVKLNDWAGARQNLQAALDLDRKAAVFTVEERSEIGKILEPNGK